MVSLCHRYNLLFFSRISFFFAPFVSFVVSGYKTIFFLQAAFTKS